MPFPPTFDRAWDETFPPDTQQANLLGQDIRNFKTDIRERLALISGTLANRPTNLDAIYGAAGYGMLYFATDTNQIFQWNGATWNQISIQSTISLFGDVSLPATKPIGVNQVINSSGTQVDIYTVPAGRKAIMPAFFVSQPGGTSQTCTVTLSIKISGVYTNLAINSGFLSVTTGALASLQGTGGIVFSAGQSISVNISQIPLPIWPCIIEFDAFCPLKTVLFTAFVNGNNTIYTVPGGKTANLFAGIIRGVGLYGFSPINYFNASGGGVTITANIVPNAGSVSSSNQILASSVVNNNNAQQAGPSNNVMNAGDFVNINSNSAAAGQVAYVTVIEQ